MLPKSNLTGHFMAGGWPSDWLAIGPRVMKFHAALPPNPMPREFAGLMLVGRPAIYQGFSPTLEIAPEIAARQYMQRAIDPMLAEAPYLTHVETPNEPAWDYDWSTSAKRLAMQWYASYFYEFARLAQARGRRAVIGNWSVGNPDFQSWQWYGKALEATRNYGAVLGRHSYGWLNTDLAYRHQPDEVEFNRLGFRKTPLIITECGAENDKGMKSWRSQYGNDMRAYFEQWLVPFERTTRHDEYVLGATVYTVGTGGSDAWLGHDVSNTPIVSYLAELAREPWPESPTPPPPRPPLTNQQVLNMIGQIGKETGQNLIGRMPHDLLKAMTASPEARKAEYTGGSPLNWGLTSAEKIELARRLGI